LLKHLIQSGILLIINIPGNFLGYFQATVPLESIGAFSAILPRWNRSLYLRFDLGKTSSNFFENSGFTSVFCGQKYSGKE